MRKGRSGTTKEKKTRKRKQKNLNDRYHKKPLYTYKSGSTHAIGTAKMDNRITASISHAQVNRIWPYLLRKHINHTASDPLVADAADPLFGDGDMSGARRSPVRSLSYQ